MELARKKDEELKKLRADLQSAEKRVADEADAKLREKAQTQQRDHKIKIIEERLKQLIYENEMLSKKASGEMGPEKQAVRMPM
jgi:hypothetical protein